MLNSILFLVCCLLVGCRTNITPDQLYGMTKEDVLKLVFSRCKRTSNDEIVIGIRKSQSDKERYEIYTYGDHFFKSLEEALCDKQLNGCSLWIIDRRHRLSFIQRDRAFAVYFEDGIVKRIEVIYISD